MEKELIDTLVFPYGEGEIEVDFKLQTRQEKKEASRFVREWDDKGSVFTEYVGHLREMTMSSDLAKLKGIADKGPSQLSASQIKKVAREAQQVAKMIDRGAELVLEREKNIDYAFDYADALAEKLGEIITDIRGLQFKGNELDFAESKAIIFEQVFAFADLKRIYLIVNDLGAESRASFRRQS